MTERKKTIEKLRKIKELAERGTGGEKEGAKRTYEELKAKFNITDAEIEVQQSEPERRKEIAFTLQVLQMQIHEEMMCCNECEQRHKKTDICRECGTQKNIRDLESQYEALAEE